MPRYGVMVAMPGVFFPRAVVADDIDAAGEKVLTHMRGRSADWPEGQRPPFRVLGVRELAAEEGDPLAAALALAVIDLDTALQSESEHDRPLRVERVRGHVEHARGLQHQTDWQAFARDWLDPRARACAGA
jgi:hypothetical protein